MPEDNTALQRLRAELIQLAEQIADREALQALITLAKMCLPPTSTS
jgi:hypothetical protein